MRGQARLARTAPIVCDAHAVKQWSDTGLHRRGYRGMHNDQAIRMVAFPQTRLHLRRAEVHKSTDATTVAGRRCCR